MKQSLKKNTIKYHILKSTGQLEPFSSTKLHRSLLHAGLRPKDCRLITDEVKQSIHHGASTRDIYKKAIRLVKQRSPVAAAHYSLRKSILDLGPEGFEFELFVSKYFESIGFKTYVGVVLQGEFVRHEVDVVGSKNNYQIYVECKFHNHIGSKNDIKTALYVKARWDDLKNGPDGKYLREFYLVSNTVFTKDAITYAAGVGLNLMGVNVPEEESFFDKIKKHGLFPITSLKRLKKSYCKELLSKKIVLCKDLLNERNTLLKMGLSEIEINAIFDDAYKIINPKRND